MVAPKQTQKVYLVYRSFVMVCNTDYGRPMKPFFIEIQKSVNLQYNTLGCLDDGTSESLTKHLMFQVLFFIMISCKILCKNPFNLFSYFFIKL